MYAVLVKSNQMCAERERGEGVPFYAGGHTSSRGLRIHSCGCSLYYTARLFSALSAWGGYGGGKQKEER